MSHRPNSHVRVCASLVAESETCCCRRRQAAQERLLPAIMAQSGFSKRLLGGAIATIRPGRKETGIPVVSLKARS